jgi:hypothetical protein
VLIIKRFIECSFCNWLSVEVFLYIMEKPSPLAGGIGVVDNIFDLLNAKSQCLVNCCVQPYDSSSHTD